MATLYYLLRLGEVDPQALQDFYQRLRASGMTVDPTIVTAKNWPNVDAFDWKIPGTHSRPMQEREVARRRI